MTWTNSHSILQLVALIGMHVLALVYDAEWIYFCIGVDALVLGIDIKQLEMKKNGKK